MTFETDDTTDEQLSPEEQAEKDLMDAGKGEKTIPKERFDQEVERLRQEAEDAKSQLAEMRETAGKTQQQNQVAQANKALADQRKTLDKLQDQYEDLLMEGDKTAARAVRKQLEQLRGQVTEAEIAERENVIKASTREETIFQRAVARMEADYPQLDPDSDQYDQEAVDSVSAMMTGLSQMKGVSRAEALRTAATRLLKKAAAPEPEKPTGKTRGLGGRMAATRQQPPDSTRVGSDVANNEYDIDVNKLKDEDFDKMEEDKLASLRGDFVE